MAARGVLADPRARDVPLSPSLALAVALVALAQGEGRLPGACAGMWDLNQRTWPGSAVATSLQGCMGSWQLPLHSPLLHTPAAFQPSLQNRGHAGMFPAPWQPSQKDLEAALPTDFGFFPQSQPFLALFVPPELLEEAEKLLLPVLTHTQTHTQGKCDLHLPWWLLPMAWGPPALQLQPEGLSPPHRLHPTTATSWASRSWPTGGWRLAAGRWCHMLSSRTR